MAIDSYVKDDILTIRVLDERLVDPEVLKRLAGRRLVGLDVEHLVELRDLKDFQDLRVHTG